MPRLTDFFTPRHDTDLVRFGPGRGASHPAVPPVPAGQGCPAGPAGTGTYLLTGPAGTGKTQLAVAFAHCLWRSRAIDLLVWVPASSRAAVLTGYAQALADVMAATGGAAASGAPAMSGGRPDGDGQEAMAARFLSWLARTSRPWLVVLDDLADAAHVADLCPAGQPGWTVLTTRLSPASISPPARDAKVVPVGAFSRREAMGFLTTRLDSLQRAEVLDLAEDLGCLPLPLAQAAAVIADSEIDCREYRARLAARMAGQNGAPGLARQAGQIARGSAATTAVTAATAEAVTAATCSLALARADQTRPPALSRPVLALAALLSPAGIPGAVFATAAVRDYAGSYRVSFAPTAETDVWAVLSALDRMGIVTINLASAVRTVSMHAAVQACVRRLLPGALRDRAASVAAESLLQAWPTPDPALLLDQAMRDCGEHLSQAAGDLFWASGAHPLLVRVGESLVAGRLAGPAIEYWRAMIETGRRLLGPAHPQAPRFVQHLAQAAEAAGRADQVIETPGQALAGRRSARRRAQLQVRDKSSAGAMFGLCARFTCRDGKSAAAFDRLVAELTEAIADNEPGTLVYATCQVRGQPPLRILYELYRDEEAFVAHWTAPHTRWYLARRDAYLTSAEAVMFPRNTDPGI